MIRVIWKIIQQIFELFSLCCALYFFVCFGCNVPFMFIVPNRADKWSRTKFDIRWWLFFVLLIKWSKTLYFIEIAAVMSFRRNHWLSGSASMFIQVRHTHTHRHLDIIIITVIMIVSQLSALTHTQNLRVHKRDQQQHCGLWIQLQLAIYSTETVYWHKLWSFHLSVYLGVYIFPSSIFS